MTGVHDVDIDLTDNTDAGFYANGYRYAVMLVPDETVDGQSISVVLAYFEIGDIVTDITAEIEALLTTAVADSVPADGSRPSIAQGIYMLTQFMLERAVSGTTLTVKKPDGSTTLMTLTLNDAVNPTSVTRAT
jgi:anti-sigma factor ChrR (cupin superfamily)